MNLVGQKLFSGDLTYPNRAMFISIYTTIGLSCTSFVRKKQLFHECD